MADKKLQVIPLGGLGDFGMNCHAIRYGDDIIVVDAGMMFPDSDMLGVDIVIPDFTFLLENRKHVRGLILTHGHEDHIGATPFLLADLNIPVYSSPLTLAMVSRRLEEHDLKDKAKLIPVKPRQVIELGPFKIEFINATHSMPCCLALAITTPLGVIIHTGDFKVDPSPIDNEPFDLHTLAEYGKRGVLLLLSDSTNVERSGYTESERAVRPKLESIFKNAEKRLIISCFSSSVPRIQQIFEIAKQFGRKVAILGRSMTSTTEICHSLGLIDIPDGLLLRPQDIMESAPSKVCVLVSGTQGEPMSALARVALDTHRHLSVGKGDTVVLSARIIPGNEKPIFRMLNHFARRGAETIYGATTPPVHVSGHASPEELKLILNLVRPRFFLPVHGEYRQLSKHAALAEHLLQQGLEKTFVMDSGDVLEIDKKGARRGESITLRRVCIDSGSLDDVVEDTVIRERRHLAEDGFVLPVLAIDKATGKLEGLPEIVSRGFISLDDGAPLLAEARKIVLKTFQDSKLEERKDWGVMQEKIRNDLKRFLSKETQRRPLIAPVRIEV